MKSNILLSRIWLFLVWNATLGFVMLPCAIHIVLFSIENKYSSKRNVLSMWINTLIFYNSDVLITKSRISYTVIGTKNMSVVLRCCDLLANILVPSMPKDGSTVHTCNRASGSVKILLQICVGNKYWLNAFFETYLK